MRQAPVLCSIGACHFRKCLALTGRIVSSFPRNDRRLPQLWQGRQQRFQAPLDIAAEVHAQGAAVVALQSF